MSVLRDWPSKLAGFDEDALAALSNKGLVRRAGKDLAKSPPTPLDADDESARLDADGHTVTLKMPPAASECTCNSGICRHILAAVLFVREQAGEVQEQAATDLAEELAGFDDDALTKWAGKAIAKKAAVLLSGGVEVERAEADGVVVHVTAQNVRVRYLGGGLAGLLCTCHAAGPCEHKVAAVVALRAERDGVAPTLQTGVLEAKPTAARTRAQVRAAVDALLHETISLGFARLSATAAQRLATLSTSARGVDLPRLERLLASTATEVHHMLGRNVAASSGRLLRRCADAAALSAALETPTHALVGQHRSIYLPVAGSVDLIGVGARRWRTPSGYHGLTCYFREPAADAWTSWTDARPVDAAGFDPAQRFRGGSLFGTSGSPRAVVNAAWRVSGLHRNALGRFSVRDNTRGFRIDNPPPLPWLTRLDELEPIAKRAFAAGLTVQRRDVDALVLMRPTGWDDAWFDPVTQAVTRPLLDADELPLRCKLVQSPETATALDTLQRTASDRLGEVAGFLRVDAEGVYLEPMTLWIDGSPNHLTLDDKPGKSSKPTPQTKTADVDDVEDDTDTGDTTEIATSTAVGQLLEHARTTLVDIADAGVRVSRDVAPLHTLAKTFHDVELPAIGSALTALADRLDHQRRSIEDDTTAPAALLRAAYLVHLALACSVTLAVTGE